MVLKINFNYSMIPFIKNPTQPMRTKNRQSGYLKNIPTVSTKKPAGAGFLFLYIRLAAVWVCVSFFLFVGRAFMFLF